MARRLAAPLLVALATGSIRCMKPAGVFAVTYLSVTQFETRHRQIVVERRRRRWLRPVGGVAAV